MPKIGTDDVPRMKIDECTYKQAYKHLTKKAFSEKDSLSTIGKIVEGKEEILESDNSLQNGMLCNTKDGMSLSDIERSRRDSEKASGSPLRFVSNP